MIVRALGYTSDTSLKFRYYSLIQVMELYTNYRKNRNYQSRARNHCEKIILYGRDNKFCARHFEDKSTAWSSFKLSLKFQYPIKPSSLPKGGQFISVFNTRWTICNNF